MIAARILADSVSPAGVRLTTLEVTMPRIVLAEFNTHRMFSRNSASSRAIPVEKRIAAVRENPFAPEAFAANQRGMQAGDVLDRFDQEHARVLWLRARDEAVRLAEALAEIGVHKQWANRLLEPFSFHTAIVTATEWENFFALRLSPEAQPEIQAVARTMRDAMGASKPRIAYAWHLPLVDERDDGLTLDQRIRVSVARCARVSYLTHDGRRDVAADLALHDRLLAAGHLSPFEHAAKARTNVEWSGNFRGWIQYRKTLPGEAVFKPKESKS